MESIIDLEKLRIFLLFSAPGLVAMYVRSQFLTGRMPALSEGIIAYTTLSLIYQAALLPLNTYLIEAGFVLENSIIGLYWILVIFIMPSIIGGMLGLNIRKGWTKKLLLNLKINTVHPVDTAWDWHFGNCQLLKDGTKWSGYIGEKSFMSSNPSERDIYIEKVYNVSSKTDEWTPRESGVWISHQEIQTIEFWPEQ